MPRLFSRPGTDPAVLRDLPQFEPDYALGEEYYDPERNVLRLQSFERDTEVRNVLAASIRQRIIPSAELGNSPAMDVFVDAAIRSIATYESRRRREPIFNRVTAKATLDKAAESMLDTRQALLEVAASHELTSFLREIFVGSHRREISEPHTRSEMNAFFREGEQLLDSFEMLSPERLADQLLRLEAVLAMASEKMKLQPDSRKNEIAQEFCDGMAHAWFQGTGEIPTFAKSNPKSRSASPFAQLLKVVNKQVLVEAVRDPFDFETYGVKAVARIKGAYPELKPVRKKRGRI